MDKCLEFLAAANYFDGHFLAIGWLADVLVDKWWITRSDALIALQYSNLQVLLYTYGHRAHGYARNLAKI